jgi:hypothetical protein
VQLISTGQYNMSACHTRESLVHHQGHITLVTLWHWGIAGLTPVNRTLQFARSLLVAECKQQVLLNILCLQQLVTTATNSAISSKG